jgi:hypothetical protein
VSGKKRDIERGPHPKEATKPLAGIKKGSFKW